MAVDTKCMHSFPSNALPKHTGLYATYVYDSHEYRYPGVLHYVYHEVRALPVAVTMRCHLSWML